MSKSNLGTIWKSIELDTVDPGLRIEEALAQAKLKSVDPYLNATNLPPCRGGTRRNVSLDLIEFPRRLTRPTIMSALERFGDPAGSPEMAATARDHSELLKRGKVLVFPGASWSRWGRRYVGYLGSNEEGSYADVIWNDLMRSWNEHCVWGVLPHK
jgi:hypothetical protein